MLKSTELESAAYQFEAKMPLKHAIPLGLQHVFAMFVGNLTPLLIITSACGLAGGEFADLQVSLLQNAMFVAGIVTLVQLYAVGPVGGKVPIIMGTSSGFLGVFNSVAATMGGGVTAYGSIMGASILGGIFESVLGVFLKPLRKLFPSVMGAGLYTYNQEQDNPRDIRKWKDTTLREYVNDCTAEDCAKGLNRMIENYNSGIQITYKLYTDEEIAAVPTRQKAEIYYFPGSDPGGKFVLVIGGNAIHTSAEMREGVSTAEWLNELGYTCFVLRYRIGDQATDNAPLEDVSRAVRYITEHAEQFHVQPEDYAVLAYSSGGQIAGLFASDSDTLGHKAYGVSKPGALLLGYPVNNFFELKPVWGLLIDPYADGPRYFDYNVSDSITPDYPPVYHWYGKNDVTLAKMYTPAQGRVIEKALVKNGVPHIFHHYHNAPHKIGPGRGTDAEGWITEAVAFWESQTAAKAADTAA